MLISRLYRSAAACYYSNFGTDAKYVKYDCDIAVPTITPVGRFIITPRTPNFGVYFFVYNVMLMYQSIHAGLFIKET